MKEVFPQFITTLIVFNTIIVVSQLGRLSDALLAFGISLENILLPLLFLLLPFASFTIPMSFLFAVILAFSRLSADGEYTALLAAGYSLNKATVPVIILSLTLYLVGVTCALYMEAWGRRELVQFWYRKTQTEVDNMIRYKMQEGVFINDFLGFVFYAESISKDRQNFNNVLLAPNNDDKSKDFFIIAPAGRISGTVEEGNLKMSLQNGVMVANLLNSEKTSTVKFQLTEIDLLRMFQDQILGPESAEDDYRSYPPGKLLSLVNNLKNAKKRDQIFYWKARYLLHYRIATAFAVVCFAFFGIVLGIHDPRKGKSTAFAGAMLTVMVSYMLLMACKWSAEKGILSAPIAAWLPNMLLLLLGGFLLFQKNRLPLSESTIDPRNIPLISKLFFGKKQTLTK